MPSASTSGFFRNNGLTLTLLLLFGLSLGGHSLAGHRHYNQEQAGHGRAPIAYGEYLRSTDFISTVFENWESEFLQMALYVWLTSFLFQRGSAESKDPDKEEAVDEDPVKHKNDPDAPGPVRTGGFPLWLYSQSLSLALLLLFLVSFAVHFAASMRANCEQQAMHGENCGSALAHLQDPAFWFESLQNWQSEFLSIAVVVVLSIFLRQKGSPESKPVHSPHSATGA